MLLTSNVSKEAGRSLCNLDSFVGRSCVARKKTISMSRCSSLANSERSRLDSSWKSFGYLTSVRLRNPRFEESKKLVNPECVPELPQEFQVRWFLRLAILQQDDGRALDN